VIKKAYIDVNKFRKQLEERKKKILEGAKTGLGLTAPVVRNTMRDYVQSNVYDVYDPEEDGYKRTYDLLNSIRSKQEGLLLIVYADPEQAKGSWGATVNGKMTDNFGLHYFYRVLNGHKVFPYEYVKPGAAYLNARDWRLPTYEEFAEHTKQKGKVIGIVKDTIRRKARLK